MPPEQRWSWKAGSWEAARERNHLVSRLQQRQIREVALESAAPYWKPVWLDLEPHFEKLHWAQAQSNRAPRARKN
jgi:hypothetical protein